MLQRKNKKTEKKVWRNTPYSKWFYNRLSIANAFNPIPKDFITMAEWCKRYGFTGLQKIHLIAYKAHHGKNRTEYLDYVKENTIYIEKIKTPGTTYGRGGGIGFIKENFPADGFTELFQLMFYHKDYILLSDFCLQKNIFMINYLNYKDYLPKDCLLKIKLKKYCRYLIHKNAPCDYETIVLNYLKNLTNKTYVPFYVAYKHSGISRQAAHQKLQFGQVDDYYKIKNKLYIPENNLYQLARRRETIYDE